MVDIGDTSANDNYDDAVAHQWVYGPIGATTISGTVTFRHRGKSGNYDLLFMPSYALWVATSSGALRGTLLSATHFGSVTFTISNNNQTDTDRAISSVSAQNGDYIVIEAGWWKDPTYFGTADTATIAIGDTDATNYMYVTFSGSFNAYVAPPLGLTYDNSGQTLIENRAMTNMSPSISGGDPITSYAVQTGALPAGVSLNAGTGIISGSPTTKGDYSWTIRGTNAGGYDDSDSLTMTVNAEGGGGGLDLDIRRQSEWLM